MYGPPPHPPLPAAPVPSAPPDRAPHGRRLAARGIDALLLFGVACLLALMTWGRLHELAVDGLWGKALGAGGTLLTSGDVGQAASDFGTSVWGSFAAAVEEAFLLLAAAELLYQFAGQAWLGRTVGKAAMDLRVRTSGDARPGAGRAFRRSVVTTAGSSGLYCLAWILLLEGQFFLSVVLWLGALAAFLLTSVPALLGRRRTLADLAAGTVVVRAGTYRRAVAAARQGAGRAWDGTQAAGQVAGGAVRESAAAQAERMRRALESEQARRVQDLGRQSADRMRGAVTGERAQRVQDAGRRFGGRVRGAYRDRRAAREVPPPPPPAALPPPSPAPYLPYEMPVTPEAPPRDGRAG
ncbi:RDD family protein [Actinomadura rubteroloni]|uniref:RDD family protein n=1 Tax=Actinomadura rubteroloni TaxID=1926885 RepID=A0A2P4UFL9_9ACTN|nr:RDD family protein [Actinomadura rubteroloni]